MNDVLGVLEALEGDILDGHRVPLTSYTLIKEKDIIDHINKCRVLIKNQHKEIARKAVESNSMNYNSDETQERSDDKDPLKNNMLTILSQTKRETKKLKKEANEYVDNMLAQLQLLVTKLQKNLIRLEKNIDDGRGVIESNQNSIEKKEEEKSYETEPATTG